MLTVSVPKLRTRDSRAAEMRPSRLQAWLDDLPQGDQEDSMQQILQALYVQNRTALEALNRLELMELYRPPVFNLAESLALHYVSVPFPMNARLFDLAGSVQRLFEELANGYKIVANDLIKRGHTRKNRKEFALALQRATHALSTIFLRCCEIYRPYPREAWRQFHQLYRLAESDQILEYEVAGVNSKSATETVLRSYERGFLIGASDPFGLHQGECAQLFQLIPGWRRHIRITRWDGAAAARTPGAFLVNLASDSPPMPLVKLAHTDVDAGKRDHYRLVSTLDVIKEVHSIMTALDASVPESLPGVNSVIGGTNADFLRRLGATLAGVNVVRHSHRADDDHQAPVCIGLNSIHFFINGQKTFQLSKQDEEPSSSWTAAKEEYFDLSDPAVGAAKAATGGRPPQGDLAMYESVHRLFTCGVNDQGAAGLRVWTRDQPGFQIHVGDLIGLQFPTPNQWSVGVVRWLTSRAASAIEFGVELLAPDFFPVAVKPDTEGAGYVQALMLPGNRSLKQPQSLLVPKGAFRAGHKLVLLLESARKYELSPVRVLDRTASYDQLLINLPGIRNPVAS